MARVALVSRNPVMSMAFSASDHSVAEIRPSSLGDWLERGEDVGVDALVLDLGSPQNAQQVVGDLRAQGRWVPVLLVATDDPAWGAADITGLPGVELLPLPLDPDRLKVALAAVLKHPRTAPLAKAAVDGRPLLDDVPDLDIAPAPDLLREESAAALPAPAPVPVPASEPQPVLKPEPVAKPEPELEPVAEVETLPLPAKAPRKPRSAQLHKHRANRDSVDQPATPIRLDPSEPPLLTPPVEAPLELLPPEPKPEFTSGDPVHWLLKEAENYYTLEELANVIVEDAVVRSMAEAGALLVPDGAVWCVAGGVALRPLEYRLQLAPEAWLVANIATAGKGVLIQGSDIARLDLRGTPLASRTHLMAVPVPQVRAILLLSRDRAEPFTEASLAALAGLAKEAGPLLEGAMDLRSLARLLAKHLDMEQSPGS